VLYFSHQYLYRANTEKIATEVAAQRSLEEDFEAYKKGINPQLLFESLEAMLSTMKSDPDAAEKLTDHFASVYRYLLAKHKIELVKLRDEVAQVQDLVALFNQLPHRQVHLTAELANESWLPPTTLLSIVEQIIRSTIASGKKILFISLETTEQWLTIRYEPEERLRYPFTLGRIPHIVRHYAFFTEETITLNDHGGSRTVVLPLLHYDERGHN